MALNGSLAKIYRNFFPHNFRSGESLPFSFLLSHTELIAIERINLFVLGQMKIDEDLLLHIHLSDGFNIIVYETEIILRFLD